MNNKNKIILLAIITILLASILIMLICISDHKNQKYYQELKDNLQEDIEKYIKISAPYCSVGSSSFTIDEETLIVQAGINKDKLLDIDGESYCKVRIKTRCVAENKHSWDTYLKCKYYEDKEYNQE